MRAREGGEPGKKEGQGGRRAKEGEETGGGGTGREEGQRRKRARAGGEPWEESQGRGGTERGPGREENQGGRRDRGGGLWRDFTCIYASEIRRYRNNGISLCKLGHKFGILTNYTH